MGLPSQLSTQAEHNKRRSTSSNSNSTNSISSEVVGSTLAEAEQEIVNNSNSHQLNSNNSKTGSLLRLSQVVLRSKKRIRVEVRHPREGAQDVSIHSLARTLEDGKTLLKPQHQRGKHLRVAKENLDLEWHLPRQTNREGQLVAFRSKRADLKHAARDVVELTDVEGVAGPAKTRILTRLQQNIRLG